VIPEIINTLVEALKQKGASTHDLLRDPLFLSLPLEKQVEVVQAYAGVLQQGGTRTPSSTILAKSMLKGMTAGIFASLPFVAQVNQGMHKGMAVGIGAVAGLGIGAVSGTLAARGEKERYETTNKYLIRLSHNPDIPNAVKVLDINRKHEPRTIASIVKKLVSPEKEIIDKSVAVGNANLVHNLKVRFGDSA
jgi:hypothetical protein